MDALLLLGPTGVGKTPLGAMLAARGLARRRCLHFDFGAALRRAHEEPGAVALDGAARHVVRRVLEQGALLEDEHFPIAAALLQGFLAEAGAQGADLLVLNGLPRHAGQARAMDRLHRVRALVRLLAPPSVVRARIRLDSGGDRAGRRDDDEAGVQARLARDRARSGPLLRHYRALDVPCCEVAVAVETTAARLYERVAAEVRELL